MVAKKMYFMDRMIDLGMTKLFQLAEYVCSRCSLDKGEPAATQSQTVTPTIRFSNEDKTEIKRVKCDVCINTFEREQARPMVKMVEGELFN